MWIIRPAGVRSSPCSHTPDRGLLSSSQAVFLTVWYKLLLRGGITGSFCHFEAPTEVQMEPISLYSCLPCRLPDVTHQTDEDTFLTTNVQ